MAWHEPGSAELQHAYFSKSSGVQKDLVKTDVPGSVQEQHVEETTLKQCPEARAVPSNVQLRHVEGDVPNRAHQQGEET